MRPILLAILLCQSQLASAQLFKKPVFSGMYFQWGYNRDKYSKSDLHFKNGTKYDFTVYEAKALDQPNFEAFSKYPLDITIPQNVYRIGFYLNREHTRAIEINFDHAKYVVKDYQNLRIKGNINGEVFDKDTVINPAFIHFEHTNGANFYHINYVSIHELLRNKKNTRTMASVIWKAGAGIVVPKSDITLFGKELDNKYHVAGYILGAEAGFRFYPLKKWFLEATCKGGFANYLNVLTVGDNGRAHHSFYYGEVIGTFGYEISFKGKKKNIELQ
jgi:hypothetical protein